MNIQDLRLRQYHNYLRTGLAYERNGKQEQALRDLRLAARKLRLTIRHGTDRTVRAKRLKLYHALTLRMERLEASCPGQPENSLSDRDACRTQVSRGEQDTRRSRDVAPSKGLASDGSADASQTRVERSEYDRVIEGCIRRSRMSWDDIAGLDETKRTLKEALVLPFARTAGDRNVAGWRNILLYGAPGTGKTMLAAAASRDLGATFFDVRTSDILSKYIGDSPKLVSTLFRCARERAPSVIFMDEVESLAGSRDSMRHLNTGLVQTLLGELDGFDRKSDDSYILFMAATNVPWKLDNAILSRFERRIHIPLPDRETREGILELHLVRDGLVFDGDLDSIVDMTEGYSGRDLGNLCREVVMSMIREMNPSLPDYAGSVSRAKPYELAIRPLVQEDFERPLRSSRQATTPAVLERIDAWKHQFGTE